MLFSVRTYAPSWLSSQGTVPSVNAPPSEDDLEDKKGPSPMQEVLSVVNNVASGLRTVLAVTNEASDLLPPLKGVVSGLLAVWEVYDVGEFFSMLVLFLM